MKLPDCVGVPLIVNTPLLKVPVTPAGNEPEVIVAFVAPPPTVYVTGARAVFIQSVGDAVAEESVMVELAFTVMVPLSDELLQGPVVETV